MYYEIEALDTLFFRDAAPFDATADVYGKSMFPPLPSVYAGALRSCYFAHHMESFVRAGEEDDPTRDLEIGLTCFKQEEDFLFPLPMDVAVKEIKEEGTSSKYSANTLTLQRAKEISSHPLPYVLRQEELTRSGKDIDLPGGFYIDHNVLNAYLQDQKKSLVCKPLADFISSEARIGIKIDRNTGMSEESMFYQIRTVRPINQQNKRITLFVETSGVDLPQQAVIKIGGESKASQLTAVSTKPEFKMEASSSQYFKLYMATPAIFSGGWLPDWGFEEPDYIGTYKQDNAEIKVKLRAAAIGRYAGVGGFDMKKGRPKAMRYAVPAGSVYYFELLQEGTFADAMELLHGKKISSERSNEGFGFCLIGKVEGGVEDV
ncbi:type III-B CRISPR module-associated protein Cmr3 [Desulfoscipio sp. XC116]|uniref:type III-B CRISPR module-associated protein Cmr3 n=1 Tax=Desulfoscipio sp. XC116 TaxID=3144975 RepID=UPI00325B7305